MEHTKLPNSLNNAIAYSWVLGWYAGKSGAPTDSGKILATEEIKAKHPDVVRACNCHEGFVKACEMLGTGVWGISDECGKAIDAILKKARGE